ncbi:peptidoglycan D,D-transpeptidase FtsI family protein [Planctomycetota bacterium]
MYNKRVKIFISIIAASLFVCLVRLASMQLFPDSSIQEDIARLKRQLGRTLPLKTVRGKILDRHERVLATDEPRFSLHINYSMSCFLDERVHKSKLLQAEQKKNANQALDRAREELDSGLENLGRIIDKCTAFGPERADIVKEIDKINSTIWNMRSFVAWRRKYLDKTILAKYDNNVHKIPLTVARAYFKAKQPNEDKRILLTAKVDLPEMYRNYPLLDLQTDDDIFTAQLEFMNNDGVEILPEAQRYYPYRSAAAQTIGWVGPAGESDKKLFTDDRLLRYLDKELCGRRPGVEYVCEMTLRGKRGEIFYDIDGYPTRVETEFGKDVTLTLDIELQEKIENFLTDPEHNSNYTKAMAVAVLDVATGDILAMVSLPVYDLNRIRYDYSKIEAAKDEPLRNRALNKQYPPGSIAKPLILIAALESGKINADDTISCPAKKAPRGWPSCWVYRKQWIGHDDKWPNKARNAIKGSCNIYFSRLADRLDALVLSQFLSEFGYGSEILPAPEYKSNGDLVRNLRQVGGIISSGNSKRTISKGEKRWFGIGQGNMRVTPLQVANVMAAIARGGIYKPPRLHLNNLNDPNQTIHLNISPETMAVVHNGMNAVVNEYGGTAYNTFSNTDFAARDVEVYGKTGSTEGSYNAWFAGFAQDSANRSISIAVLVEQGQSGAKDAAPLGRDIIGFCIDAGYIGNITE